MLCDDCKERPASVHITKIYNNQKTERHMCDQCAQKSGEIGISTDSQVCGSGFLKGMFSHGIGGRTPAKKRGGLPRLRYDLWRFQPPGQNRLR